jgi:multiple sugar transport system substrate-binding protein
MHRSILTVLVNAMLVVAACGTSGGSPTPSVAGPSATAGGTPTATAGGTPTATAGGGIVIDPNAVSGTVRLSGWQSSTAEETLLQETVDAFRAKYPNITVDYESIPTDYTSVMIGQFSAGEPPDVFYVQAGEGAAAWMEDGLLEPLDPYIQGNNFDTTAFYPQILSAFQLEGTTYGLPKDAGPLALFYNTDMLGEAGVEVPTTWDELRSVAAALTTADHAGLCIGPELPRVGAFIEQAGGGIYNEDKTELTITSPESVAGIDFYLELHTAGSLKTPTELGAGWCGEAFGLGKAAMAYEGTWLFPPMENDYPDIAFDVAELPQGVQQGNLTFTNAYGMGVDSANKEGGWVLLSYLTGPEGMAKWTSGGLALPSRTDVPAPPDREAHTAGLAYGTAYAFGRNFPDIQAAFNNELTAVLAGSGTGQQIADAAAAAEK